MPSNLQRGARPEYSQHLPNQASRASISPSPIAARGLRHVCSPVPNCHESESTVGHWDWLDEQVFFLKLFCRRSIQLDPCDGVVLEKSHFTMPSSCPLLHFICSWAARDRLGALTSALSWTTATPWICSRTSIFDGTYSSAPLAVRQGAWLLGSCRAFFFFPHKKRAT